MTVLGSKMQGTIFKSLTLLIGVLPLSDENSDEIEIAIPGGAPNDSEAELSLRVLADIEGYFVLAVPGVAEFGVFVHGPSQELLADCGVSVVGSVMEGCPLTLIKGIDICLVPKQHADCRQATFLACKVEGCAALRIFSLNRGSVLQQDSHYSSLVTHTSEVKSCLAKI